MNAQVNTLLEEIAILMHNALPEDAQSFVLYLRAGADFAEHKPRFRDAHGGERGLANFADLDRFDPQRTVGTLAMQLHDAWQATGQPAWTWMRLEVDRAGHFEVQPYYEPLDALQDVLAPLARA